MEDDRSKLVVPKFTSFKSKPSPSVGRSDAQRRPDVPKKAKHRKQHNRENDGPVSSSKYRATADRYADSKRKDQDVGHGDLFTTQTRGDKDILTYGHLPRFTIPAYRRYGCGAVIGLPKRLRIASINEDAYSVTTLHHDRTTSSDRELRSRAIHLPDNPLSIIPSRHHSNSVPTPEYVGLEDRRAKRRRLDWTSNLSMAESSSSSDIEPDERAPPQASREDDLITSANLTQDDMGIVLSATSKNSSLEHLTRQNPDNVQAWMELIQHQAAVLQIDSSHQSTRASGRIALADIRLSIYKRALRAVSVDNRERDRLVAGLLKEGARLWHAERCNLEWRKAVQQTADSTLLWQSYADFVQTDLASFTYEECRSIYMHLLAKVSSANQPPTTASHLMVNNGELLTHAILRLTVFQRDAGYTEQAVATWQALLEYMILRPRTHSKGTEHSNRANQPSLESFREFWESRERCIGETCRLDSPGRDPRNALITSIRSSQMDQEICFKTFSKIEDDAGTNSYLPGRPLDETEHDDPFHVVLFSDLEPILALLPTSLESDLLIEAVLSFFGLPCLAHCECKGRAWQSDPMIQQDLIVPSVGVKRAQNLTELLRLMQSQPMVNQIITSADLFDEKSSIWPTNAPHDVVFSILASLTSSNLVSDSVVEYHMALTHRYFPSASPKAARSNIKRRPSSLRLYNAYALMSLDDDKVFDRIVCNSLKLSASLNNDAQWDAMLLWRSCVWKDVRGGFASRALKLLTCIPDGIPGSGSLQGETVDKIDVEPGRILRLGRHLASLLDETLSAARIDIAVICVELRALADYLYNQETIESATKTFQAAFALLRNRNAAPNPVEELLCQTYAQFWAFHVGTSRQFKPSLLKAELRGPIETYPHNTLLLAIYAANDSQVRISSLFGTTFQAILSEDKQSLSGWAFAIWSEMHRGIELGSTAHSVRAMFDRALSEDSVARHCAALWNSYVRFEHRLSDMKRAKAVFFRGLKEVPWCKSFMMLAFGVLADALSFAELKQIYDLMLEKGLRVHVDIQDQLEAMEDEDMAGARLNDDGHDDYGPRQISTRKQ